MYGQQLGIFYSPVNLDYRHEKKELNLQ
jgi:hypothetical protein